MTDEVTQEKAVTIGQWKKARKHTVLLPSGVHVTIQIPDLPALIEAGEIPQTLLDAAIAVVSDPTRQTTKEDVIQQRQFTDKLVSLTVVEPKITEEDARDLPYEDKEMLVELATRQRDLDAEGEHIAGLTKSEKFRQFRGLSNGNSLLEGA